MRVVISAGGTGGHIYPALSILNKIKEEDPSSEFLYIGTTDRMESKLVPELGINYYGIEICGISKNIKKSIKGIYLFFKSIKLCKKKIKEFNPDIVIGVGGYVTAPVIISAHKLGIKTIIHEQNSIPGKSNKLLVRYTDKILCSMPRSMSYFKSNKVVLTGNPRSSEAYNSKGVDRKELGFDNKPIVLIVMGSLGSYTINNELKKIVTEFKNKPYNVMLITGNNYYNEFNMEIPSNVKIYPFINNLVNVLKTVDLIVTRAGASTMAEITAIGLPSILVPSPYVANNHQYYNAKEVVDNKGGLLLEESNFNCKNLLKNIDLILNDDKLYESMMKETKKLGVVDSLDRIYSIIKELTK